MERILPLALALLAFVLRLPHLGWGLPEIEEEALPMKKALDMWGWGAGAIDWNPHTAGWPSLSFYVHLLLQHLQYGLGRIGGAYGDRLDYFVANWLDPTALTLVSRGLSAVAAAAITCLGARLTQRLAGKAGGALAGGLLALSPLLVEYGQLVTPDILLALFAALAVDRLVAIHERGRSADYVWAGLWIGLGISSKYTPLLLIPALFTAHRLSSRPSPWRRPALALATGGGAFALTSPFVFLDLPTLVRDVSHQALHMTAGHFGQSAGTGVVRYLTDVIGPGLGWTGFALAVAGLAWAALRRGGPWWVLLACVVPYYLGLALLRTQFPRYMLPLLMPLAAGLGGLALAIRAHVPAGALRTTLLASVGIVSLAPGAVGTWRHYGSQARSSTQVQANRFIQAAADSTVTFVVAEVLSVSLPTARSTQNVDPALVARLSSAQRQRLFGRRVYELEYLPMYSVQPERSAFYYDLRHYLAYDFVAISHSVRDRYFSDTTRYATQVGFYRDLERHAALVARIAPGPETRGPEIRIYRIPPDPAATLERSLGSASLDFDPSTPTLNPPDYMRFVEGVARSAYAKGRWAMAARYYQALLQAGEAVGMAAIERLKLTRLVATLRLNAGDAAAAAGLLERYLSQVPDDAEARSMLEKIRSGAVR